MHRSSRTHTVIVYITELYTQACASLVAEAGFSIAASLSCAARANSKSRYFLQKGMFTDASH